MLGLGHGDEISVAMSRQHRGFHTFAYEWTWREPGTRRPRREHRTVVAIALPIAVQAAVSTIDRGGLHVETLGPPADFLAELLSRIPAQIWGRRES
ncbi:hypothetical protein [Amycolatopsis alkalitolerans]|uniref:Uncharacterized protein n=1 Tax=Amycolatopsis alkalitolerans TaxID=2547244 RepID=A0A5C4LRP2_9PSEU|nr:hypothetical protein [Amycolatopsis alkalitolerans]TNC21093.1 hypothetical protein FG385_29365 [Amycolatopsis alkalitolerans]